MPQASPSPEYWTTIRSGAIRETPVAVSLARPCGESTVFTSICAAIVEPQPTPSARIVFSARSSSVTRSQRIWLTEPWPHPGHQDEGRPVWTSSWGEILRASTPSGGV